jgi:mRNA interferase MazF
MRRGKIWLINLDPTVGAEIRKTRPAVIVNDDAVGILPLKVIVPITDWKDRYAVAPWMVRLDPDRNNGLTKPSAARRLGNISGDQLREITAALASVLKIHH